MFNKVDVEPHDFALEWMADFEAYQRALNAANASEGGEGSYMNSLMGSMCLVLEEFYNNLRVSSLQFRGISGGYELGSRGYLGGRCERHDWPGDEVVL